MQTLQTKYRISRWIIVILLAANLTTIGVHSIITGSEKTSKRDQHKKTSRAFRGNSERGFSGNNLASTMTS
ncbi:MAG: hypothetical protein AB2L20_32530 [Mangrovibacterium sp.]